MKINGLIVGFFLFFASAFIVVLAKSQERTPDVKLIASSADNPLNYQNLDFIFSLIEKDLNSDAGFELAGGKHAALERLAKSYELKAKDGDRAAQFKIGAMYLEGVGVRTNYGEAMRWFTMAGTHDHPLSQLAEGKLYLKCREDDTQDDRLREATIESLGKIGPGAAQAAPLLEQEIQRQDRFSQAAAVALGRIGERGVPILTEALASKDVDLRRGAAEGLALAGDAARPAIPALNAALKDEDSTVRRSAERALKRLRSKEEPK